MDFDALMSNLKAKGVNPNPDWLRDRVSGESGAKPESIFIQFLNIDISESSLPLEFLGNGLRQPSYTIGESVILQINEIIDVSIPSGKRKNFELAPGGTLKLLLTDGAHALVGISKKPMKFINPAQAPGAKMLLRPPVVAKYGVLLLSADNTHVYGGTSPLVIEKRKDIVRKADKISQNQNQNQLAIHQNRQIQGEQNQNQFPGQQNRQIQSEQNQNQFPGQQNRQIQGEQNQNQFPGQQNRQIQGEQNQNQLAIQQNRQIQSEQNQLTIQQNRQIQSEQNQLTIQQNRQVQNNIPQNRQQINMVRNTTNFQQKRQPRIAQLTITEEPNSALLVTPPSSDQKEESKSSQDSQKVIEPPKTKAKLKKQPKSAPSSSASSVRKMASEVKLFLSTDSSEIESDSSFNDSDVVEEISGPSSK